LRKQNAFGIIQALIIITLISGLLMIAMKYATLSVKQTVDIYTKEQAKLFLNSAIELSLLAIEGYERNSSNHCLKEINITSNDHRFIANIKITDYYLLAGSKDCEYCGTLCNKIGWEESHAMVMMEATVETNNTHPKNTTPIRLTYRGLQRP